MKLQKTTLGLLISAILLSLGVAAYEFLAKPQQEDVQQKNKQIFTFKEDNIKQITISKNKETLQFEKTENPEQIWKMTQPQSIDANDAVVSFLINLLVNGETENRFNVTQSQLKDYGLDNSSATITINLSDDQTHKIILGKADFQDKFIYAKIDKQDEVLLVPKDFQFALDRELSEWQQIDPEPQKSPSPTSPNHSES